MSGENPAFVIVSPHFPPSTVAGVHRARHLANHLPSHGYKPVVVRVGPEAYTELPDPELARLVSPDLEQIATGAFASKFTRKFGVGDIGLRAFPHLTHAVAQAINTHDPAAVMLTGAPFYPLLLTRFIKKRFAVPVIVDLQDPWVSDYGATSAITTKRRIAYELARRLEPIALRHADFVTSVSEVQNAQLRERYSFLSPNMMAAIPIGGDPADFDALRRCPPSNPLLELDTAYINFVYVGTFLPRAGPLVRTLFQALRSLASESPRIAENVRFTFVGTSNQPADVKETPVMDIANTEGVGEFVVEYPRRVPFLEALALLAQADVLLMIGSDEPHYTASKIYPNLMAKRPFLSIFHSASSSHSILSDAGGGCTFAFDSAAALEALVPDVKAALEYLVTSREQLPAPNEITYQQFSARQIAGQYAEIINEISRRPDR